MLAPRLLLIVNMALKTAGAKVGSLLLGTCTPCLKHNASKIRVTKLEFDRRLLMYFKNFFYVYAHDPEKICKDGDIVLIEKLPKNLSTSITHKVLEVIYPLGDITDPVTGKKVLVSSYRDEKELKEHAFGQKEPKFNYKKAPKRGWQEDKKDFTHREPYFKYHEFGEGDENEKQPYAKSYV